MITLRHYQAAAAQDPCEILRDRRIACMEFMRGLPDKAYDLAINVERYTLAETKHQTEHDDLDTLDA
jgi:hypothetical protein